MQKPLEKDIVIEGQLIHYYHVEALGEKKNVLVFLHGWGSNSPLWFSSTVELAEKGYELYFLDLPGFGKSQTPKKAFQLQDFANIVVQCVQKLEIVNPVLIGHSFGGKTAIRIASKKSIPLAGLVLVDSSGLPHTSFSTQTKIKLAKTVKPFMDLPFMKGIRSNLLRLSGSDDYIAFPELRETFVNIIREHIEFELPQVKNKTFIVWGGDDENSYTPVSDVGIFHRLIPVASAHIIQEAGHYCFLDKPKEFQTVLLEFLDSLNGKN
ncbi:MAG: alpha/beta hydrolase [Candidatus Roizmanbacteria bacterium]|nr:alpha/beta hydrolase [Candidatus Roizmanbacteria bacterium]